MGFDPSQHSVVEIRRRFLEGEDTATAEAMRRLARDPRKGVREIHERLLRRRERQRERRRRRDELLELERLLWQDGVTRVAGVDEAGVGPLAGPVVAAAVVLPAHSELDGVDDSKRLDATARQRAASAIRERASVGTGIAEVEEIDELNIYRAGLLAMRRAVDSLIEPPEQLLVDARRIPDLDIPQRPIVGGDARHLSIAAASIVAKTVRDGIMRALDATYPDYGFASHKGYSTAAHRDAIERLGPCPAHRKTFSPMPEIENAQQTIFAAEDR